MLNNKIAHRKDLSRGWLHATPLKYYSSLHEISWKGLVGINIPLAKTVLVEFNYNLRTPLEIRNDVYLTLHTCDDIGTEVPKNCSFSLKQLIRWRIDIAGIAAFDEFVQKLKRWHRCIYTKSKDTFDSYGSYITYEGQSWGHLAEEAYKLYVNVASKHGYKMYDLSFFQKASERDDHHLMCAWFEGKMIAMSLLREEASALHATCCGLDYDHSSKSYAYSYIYYEIIRWAIASGRFDCIDAGLTADELKKMIGFKPVPSRIDIYSNFLVTHHILKLASRFVSASVDSESKVKIAFLPKVFQRDAKK